MKEIIKLLENEGILKRLKWSVTVAGGDAVKKDGGTSDFISFYLTEIMADDNNEELATKFLDCVFDEVAKEVEKKLDKMEAPELSKGEKLLGELSNIIKTIIMESEE